MNPSPLYTSKSTDRASDTNAQFLSVMDSIMPWPKLRNLMQGEITDIPAVRLESLLRLYLVQHWFGLCDWAVVTALHDSQSIQTFAGFEQHNLALPGRTEIAEFHRRLDGAGIASRIKAMVDRYLLANRYFLKPGSHRDPVLVRYDEESGRLAPLAEHFRRMARPYELKEILEFNGIYRRVFHDLNPAERRLAERYVERLIDNAANPQYVPRIFGVV
jgi:hypothetical protein